MGLLILFLGTRDGVGTDFPLYETLYGSVNPDFWDYSIDESPQEVGYTFLQLIAKSVGLDFGSFLIVMAVVTVIPVYLSLSKLGLSLSHGLAFYVVLGPYLASFNILRQGIAMALLLYAAAMLPSRIKFLLLVALAGLIHASAIPVAGIIYLLKNRAPTFRLAIAASLAGLILAAVYASSPILLTIATTLNPRYGTYLVTDESGLGSYLIGATHLALVLFLVRRRDVLDDTVRPFLTYAIAGVPFMILGTQSVVLGRLGLYFVMFLIPVLASVWKSLSPGLKVMVGAAAICYYAAYVVSFGDLVPYRTTLTAG